MNKQIVRSALNYSTVAGFIYNRNPRNLERLTFGYKPTGWHLEKTKQDYWHKLIIEITGKNITVYVKHFTGAVPVTASTKEWAIKKHLYSSLDKGAYSNLGRVLGRRCLETGITEMHCDFLSVKSEKIRLLLQELEKYGVSLTELPRYIHPRPSDLERPQRPWEVHLN